MDDFKKMILEAGLIDLDLAFHGQLFTWSNKRYDGSWVKERIENCVQMSDNLHFPNSVHTFLIIYIDFVQLKGRIRFKFESLGQKSSKCGEIVAKAWGNAVVGY